MKKAIISLILIFLIPFVYSDSCIDIICDLGLSVWDSSGCYNEICIEENDAEQAYECYGVLCNGDMPSINRSILNRSCQTQLCGNYSNIEPPEDNTSETQDTQNQSSLLNPTLDELDARLDELESNYGSVEASIGDLSDEVESIKSSQGEESSLYNELRKDVEALQSTTSDLTNKVSSAQETLVEMSSPLRSVSFFYILIAVITVGLFTFSAINSRKIKKLKKATLTPIQKNQIRSYITRWSKMKYPLKNIKNGLMQQGWTEEQIREAYGKKI